MMICHNTLNATLPRPLSKKYAPTHTDPVPTPKLEKLQK